MAGRKYLLYKRLKMEILKFSKMDKGTLKGYFNLCVTRWNNFIINDMRLFEKGNQRWVNLPSRQYEENGEKKYFPINSFKDQKDYEEFKAEVLKALDSRDAIAPSARSPIEGKIPF